MEVIDLLDYIINVVIDIDNIVLDFVMMILTLILMILIMISILILMIDADIYMILILITFYLIENYIDDDDIDIDMVLTGPATVDVFDPLVARLAWLLGKIIMINYSR